MCPGFFGVRFFQSLDNHFFPPHHLASLRKKLFNTLFSTKKETEGDPNEKGTREPSDSLRCLSVLAVFLFVVFFLLCIVLMYLILSKFGRRQLLPLWTKFHATTKQKTPLTLCYIVCLFKGIWRYN